jgi:hypothetical protein
MNHRISISLAVATVSLCLSGLPADAGTTCKSQTSIGSAWSSGGEAGAWVAKVKTKYGSTWANFALAKNKLYSSQSFLFQTLYTVTAYPCRHT